MNLCSSFAATFSTNTQRKSKTDKLLPPQEGFYKGKITIVLDLDETLIHTTVFPQANQSLAIDSGGKDSIPFFVSLRPNVKELITELGHLYEIVIFSSAPKHYVDQIVKEIDPNHCIQHVLYKESCITIGGCLVKDLSKLNRELSRIIIIDDSSISFMLQPYNAIQIPPWNGDDNDKEIRTILDFLIENAGVESVYKILVQEAE